MSAATPHFAASMALESYRTRLGAVLAFIDDAAAARIQLPTDETELSATLNGLLEYFLGGEAAFTAANAELKRHAKRVKSLELATEELRQEEARTALLVAQLQLYTGTADAAISDQIDTAEALRAGAASGSYLPRPRTPDTSIRIRRQRAELSCIFCTWDCVLCHLLYLL